jgi:hypothetical protein
MVLRGVAGQARLSSSCLPVRRPEYGAHVLEADPRFQSRTSSFCDSRSLCSRPDERQAAETGSPFSRDGRKTSSRLRDLAAHRSRSLSWVGATAAVVALDMAVHHPERLRHLVTFGAKLRARWIESRRMSRGTTPRRPPASARARRRRTPNSRQDPSHFEESDDEDPHDVAHRAQVSRSRSWLRSGLRR